jgi:teichuronic acid exporter
MNFGSRIVAGLSWTAGGKFASQLVSWVITIYVMRILSPADYGLLAMATVLISTLSMLSDLGLSQAAVSAREVENRTLRLIFGLALLVNGTLYCLLFITAPMIAAFYAEPRLALIIRVVGLQFLLGAFTVIPGILLQRALEFKWRSIIGLATAILSAVTTLVCAMAGLGVWSLILGSMTAAVLSMISLNMLCPFLHLPSFALKGSGKLFEFGGHVVSARILGTLYTQADTAIGARVLGTEQIGFFSVSMQLASLPMQRVAAILNSVAFPAFAKLQDQPELAARYLIRALNTLSIFSFPVFWGIAVTAPKIIGVFLGSKWSAAVIPLQLLALIMPLRIVWQMMPPILYGLGYANIVAQNHVVAFVAMIVAFLVGVQYGIVGLSLAWVLMFPVVFIANFRTWLPIMNVDGRAFFATMGRPLVAASGMAACVLAFDATSNIAGVLNLIAMISVGAVSYVILIWMLDRNGIRDIQSIVFRRQR